MRTPTREAAHDIVIGHRDFDHGIDRYSGFEHRFGLSQGAWKSIKEESQLAIGLGDPLLDETDDDVIGYEASAVHYDFGLFPKLGAGHHRGPKHIAGRDLWNSIPLADVPGLGPFAGTRWSEKNQSHA